MLSAAAALVAVPALAADMPAKVPLYQTPVVAARSWTGCYIGLNAGWVGSATHLRTYPTGDWRTNLTVAQFDSLTKNYHPRDSGFTGGEQVGCNWQFDRWVLGVEGDVNGTRLRDSVTHISPEQFVSPSTDRVSASLAWYATVRARLGYTWDRLLIYASAGAASGRVKASTAIDFTPALPVMYTGSTSSNRTGWTAGGGLEYAWIYNWSVKVEYLYVDLGSFSYIAPRVPASANFVWGADVDSRFHVVRVGLNYRFNWGGPVVAGY
jgi:outer membrane immunogenic protein